MDISKNEQAIGLDQKMLSFQVLRSSGSGHARLGKLAIAGRKTLDTPHYVGHTTRGVISHLSHDTFQQKTPINGVYVALEDCECPSYFCGNAPRADHYAHVKVVSH